ncbi:hypothetical protein psal_cds_175 [Pandoravirus salinus]|uniref:Uncharacterized protein n=1 Tax=Pandoravirus salinus TaxID=1349410 RepID=S4VW59_9VIRU|nr:hypothetical protein psal_cds_175 [Pandoravirus salinus]AGO83666.1 hypothetical protein psal_cds_175 [Pandoravirus salinus]
MEPSGGAPARWACKAQAEDGPTDKGRPFCNRRGSQVCGHDKDQRMETQCQKDERDDDDDDLCVWEEDGIEYAHIRLDTGDDLKLRVVSYDF